MRISAKFLYTLPFFFALMPMGAQSQRYLKLSAGKIYFGTGDIAGYSIYTDYSFWLGKQKQTYWKHFQAGGELGFETGAIQQKVIVPSSPTDIKPFYQVSSSSLYCKLVYYPISNTFLKGLHVAIGPTAGYYIISQSAGGEISVYPDGSVVRKDYLAYRNYAFIGYKISAGYEYNFKKVLIGARLDWSNNQKGDINTMYGGKIGWRL